MVGEGNELNELNSQLKWLNWFGIWFDSIRIYRSISDILESMVELQYLHSDQFIQWKSASFVKISENLKSIAMTTSYIFLFGTFFIHIYFHSEVHSIPTWTTCTLFECRRNLTLIVTSIPMIPIEIKHEEKLKEKRTSPSKHVKVLWPWP